MNTNCSPHKSGGPETPVERVIRVFGTKRAAIIADVTTEALRKWNRRRSAGGGGGLVPAAHQAKFLAAAREQGLDLTAADLIGDGLSGADRLPAEALARAH